MNNRLKSSDRDKRKTTVKTLVIKGRLSSAEFFDPTTN